jgi:hypothetical protein
MVQTLSGGSPALGGSSGHTTEVQSMREGFTGEEAIARAKYALKGEYTQLGINPLTQTLPKESYDALLEDLRSSGLRDFEWIRATDAFRDMFNEGRLPQENALKLFEKIGWYEIAQQVRALREAGQTTISDYLNLPRTFSATGDLSANLRQNILTVGKPKEFAKAWGRNVSSFVKNNPQAAMLAEKSRYTSESGQAALKYGLRRNQWGDAATFGTGSERFASKLAKRFPLVRRAELGYAHGGNMLRMDLWDQIYEQYRGQSMSDKQWQDMAHVINLITGEGDPKMFGSWASTLNAVFFAPRLLGARVRSITDLFNPKLSKVARRYLAAQVSKFVGVNLGVLGAMSLAYPGSVEWDRRSTDFLKIKIGNMHFDFWGGYLPLARTVIRLAEGKKKTQAGDIVDAETMDTISSFLQAKLGPIPATVLDLVKGEKFYGGPVDWRNPDDLTRVFYERFTPFFVQDIIDAARYHGVAGGAVAAPVAFFGGGVSTYEMTPSARRQRKMDQYAREATGQKWDQLGPEVQNYLRDLYPQIEYEERAARYENSQVKQSVNFLKEQRRTARRIRENMPKDVRDELDNLQVTTGYGIGNKIGDWRMNDERFKQYEQGVSKAYNTILPKLMNSPAWASITEAQKLEVLNSIFTEIKASVREQIILQANLSDLESIRNR